MTKFLKALYAFLIIPMFFFCGCEKTESKTPSVVTDFTADFSAEFGGLELNGKITTNRQGVLSLSFTKPDTLSGLNVNYKNSELRLSRDGLICTADEAYLPETGFPAAVKSALKALSDSIAVNSADFSGGTCKISAPRGDCTLQIDSNGIITEIECEAAQLKIEFSNVEPIG